MWRLRDLHQINQVNQIRRNRPRVYRDRFDINDYSDEELFERIRLQRDSFTELVNRLSPHLPNSSFRNKSISKRQQVYIALRFYATGGFLQLVGDAFGVHKSSVCRIVHKVTDALIALVPELITPQHYYSEANANFFIAKGLPNVVGSVDGTHIEILAPKDFEQEYVNRKGYHSINTQIVGTGDLLITDIVADWAGGTHDSRVLTNSAVYRAFEGDDFGRSILLADQGYGLRSWLFTPINRNNLNQSETRFNRAHKSARCSIERLIGVWKKRWNCLNGMRMEPQKAARIIVACAVLHNFVTLRGEIEPELEIVDRVVQQFQVANDNDVGRAARAFYIQRYF